MLGLRVLNHYILPTLKPQENSLAADKHLWKPTLGFVPGHEQRNGLLTGFSSTQAALLQRQEAFVSISRLLGWILFWVEPCEHSILSSHTSLPPYSLTLHARNKTLRMWAMRRCSSETPVQTTNTGKSLLRWASSEPLHPTPPWPWLSMLHIHTPALWARKSSICFHVTGTHRGQPRLCPCGKPLQPFW